MAVTNAITSSDPDDRPSQAERSALSDQRMLEAAIRLIVARGPAGTTLKEVGELAGYSRGLAGHRFGSKAGLLAFVLRRVGEEWLAELKRVTAGKIGLQAIFAATDAHFDFCRAAPDHVRAFYLLWFESIGPDSELKAVIAKVHERRRRDVESWIEKGIEAGALRSATDARSVAEAFCAAIIGIVYQWLLEPEALERIRAMHEQLKHTMQELLQLDVVEEFNTKLAPSGRA